MAEAHVDDVDPAVVHAVLAGISTSPDSDAPTVVSADGAFRIGSLRGRHHKDRVEHVGVTARLEALERMRGAARTEVAAAEQHEGRTSAQVDRWTAHRGTVAELVARLPATGALDSAVQRLRDAEELVQRRQDRVERTGLAVTDAEAVRDDREDHLRRLGATLQLPRTRVELATVRSDLTSARGQLHQIGATGDGTATSSRPRARTCTRSSRGCSRASTTSAT